MQRLLASDLLTLWERGLDQGPVARAMTMLTMASPETPFDVLERLSIGRRDAFLLALRERAFGSQLVGLTDCPGCGDRLELSCDIGDIRLDTPSANQTENLVVNAAGYQIHFRLPNSLDLAAITNLEEPDSTQRALLERCIERVQREGEERSTDELPAAALDTVADRMAEADPQADVRLSLACPSCSCRWEAVFDIVSFLWQEINAWAYRMLQTVHTLASTYGWAEHDILAMRPARREAYLEMISG